jgi:uncharacterized protein (DUF1697 family)
MKYIALLRGINVGGNNKVPMADLRECLEKLGLKNVQTYIQSGNVIFESDEKDEAKLTHDIEQAIETHFGFPVVVALFGQPEFEYITTHTPKDWLKNSEHKYNYLFLKKPWSEAEVIAAIGPLKPELESATAGKGVIYQSMSVKFFGRTTGGKIAGKPVYKLMTIRNHNTVTKLLGLLREQ